MPSPPSALSREPREREEEPVEHFFWRESAVLNTQGALELRTERC